MCRCGAYSVHVTDAKPKRVLRLPIMLTTDERSQLDRAAEAERLDVSAYVRRAALLAAKRVLDAEGVSQCQGR